MNERLTNDPMVDEVRRIRREVAEQHGNDLDRLGEHLRQIEREYDERQGAFAAVTKEAAARVTAAWGDLTGPPEDPITDQVRSIQQARRG